MEENINWTASLDFNDDEKYKNFTCTSTLRIDPEEIKRSLFNNYKISDKSQIIDYTSDYNSVGTLQWVI